MIHTETLTKIEIDGDNLTKIDFELIILPHHDAGQMDPPPVERELSRTSFGPEIITEEMVATVANLDPEDGPDFEIKPFGWVFGDGVRVISRWLLNQGHDLTPVVRWPKVCD